MIGALGSTGRLGLSRGAGGFWTPARIRTSLWLDAGDASTVILSGLTVSQWNDKSGNSFHLSQPTASLQPTYLATGLNGRPTLSTDGNDSLSRLDVPLIKNVNQANIGIVLEYPVGASFLNNPSELFVSNSLQTTTTRLLLTPGASVGAANRLALAGRRLDTDQFNVAVSSTDSLALRGLPFFKVAQADYQNAQANHWTNATQDMTAAAYHTAGNTSNTNSMLVSVFTGISQMPSGTKISEIVIIENELSTLDRQRLEGYFAWRWGLVGNLPAGHPFKSAPPR